MSKVGFKKKDLEKFATRLAEEKARILGNADRSKEDDLQTSHDDLADEVDLATSGLSQSLSLRLRDRERMLLQKIEEALQRIDDGSFGICEECEELIEAKRLEARPVATLCIKCKENQERDEKIYA